MWTISLLLLDVHVSPMWCEGGQDDQGRIDHCWSTTQSTCSAQTQTRIGLLEEIPRSGVQIPCLS
jgi:hypothetical protein